MALALTNSEIVSCLPIVADYYEKANGGTATTVKSKALGNLDFIDVEGAYICFLSGANRGVDRIVSTYTAGSIGTISFDALGTAIDNTTQFALVFKGFLPSIERAAEVIENDLRNKGLDLSLFLNTPQLKQLHLSLTLSYICMMKRQDATADDVFHQDYIAYTELYESELGILIADYDINENGSISVAETNFNPTQMSFQR